MHPRWEVLVDSRYCSSWKVQTRAAVRFVSYATWVVFHSIVGNVDIRIPRESVLSNSLGLISLMFHQWDVRQNLHHHASVAVSIVSGLLYNIQSASTPKNDYDILSHFFWGRDTLGWELTNIHLPFSRWRRRDTQAVRPPAGLIGICRLAKPAFFWPHFWRNHLFVRRILIFLKDADLQEALQNLSSFNWLQCSFSVPQKKLEHISWTDGNWWLPQCLKHFCVHFHVDLKNISSKCWVRKLCWVACFAGIMVSPLWLTAHPDRWEEASARDDSGVLAEKPFRIWQEKQLPKAEEKNMKKREVVSSILLSNNGC